MADIEPPQRREGEADRYGECREAIEAELYALIGQARYAGWSEDEVASALMEFAADNLTKVMVRHRNKAGVKAAIRRRL